MGFGSFGGLPIVYSPFALEKTQERLFPESKHRSARIRKKLIKRFGGEFRMVPCIFKTRDSFIVHPNLKPQFEAAIRASNQREQTQSYF